MKKDIKSMTQYEIEKEFIEIGLPKYKSYQVYSWLSKGTHGFDKMTNINKETRHLLAQKYFIPTISIERKQTSKLDGTVKYLFKLHDNTYIETVVMKYKHGNSICVSTQVGCKMGCDFCATGKCGFTRNLEASEIMLQIQKAQEDLQIRISNVVLMGMGEPLDNYDNVIRFIKLISSDDGLNIGMRHITLSTCGIVDKIYQLADLKLQITLTISLHSPNDYLRNKTMPINKKYPLFDLMKACKYYETTANKRISFEYAMIDGVNDTTDCAKELSHLLKGIKAHVNLIPINNVRGTIYSKSKNKNIDKFKQILEMNNINVTVRRTLGNDIDASCGQLKANSIIDK